jgi:hypothetical protein
MNQFPSFRPDFVAAGLITAHSATDHPATFSSAEFKRILRRAVELHGMYRDGAKGPVASTMALRLGDHGIQHRFSVTC